MKRVRNAALGVGLLVIAIAGVRHFTRAPALPADLLRHYEMADLDAIAQGDSVGSLEPLEGFVFGHQGAYEDVVAQINAHGERGYRYFNVLTTPLPEWVGGGSPWFDWVDSTVVHQWNAIVRTPKGEPCVFPWFGGPYVQDWSQIDGEDLELYASKLLSYRGASPNLFLDQFWLEPEEWMFDDTMGDPDLTAEMRNRWRANTTRLLEILRATPVAPSLAPAPHPELIVVVVNGDHTAPMPLCLENSQNNFRAAQALWEQHPDNILSIDPGFPAYEDTLTRLWVKRGGWISVTGTQEETEWFYTRAAFARKAFRKGG